MRDEADDHAGFRNGQNKRRALRGLFIVIIAATALGYIYREADRVSPREHQSYARNLGRLAEADARFNAAVLTSHFGMRRDFDAIGAAIADVRSIMAALQTAPAFLSAQDRQLLSERLHAYRDEQTGKENDVDLYQREISVLRNSMAYFPLAVNTYIGSRNVEMPISRKVGIFARGVMGYALTGDPVQASALRERLAELETIAEMSSNGQPSQLENLLVHANVILSRKPRVDALTDGLLGRPTEHLAREISHAYSLGYEHASERSHAFRVLLFATALGLAAYLVLAFMRIERTSQALADVNRDLEDRIDALHRTQEELRLYANVFTNASEGMTITDAERRIVAVNPAFTRITGYEPEEVVGWTPSVISSGKHDASFYASLWRTLAERGQWQGEIWDRRRSGELFPNWLSITAVRDAAGKTSHYIGIFSDITERKEAEARIHHLAHHDALTNLPNRLLLSDHLNRLILMSRRLDKRAAVLVLDLDRFKTINDTLGHEAGDTLLLQVRDRCLSAMRNSDVCARQGGDEFVVLLTEIRHAQDAAQVARKILAALSLPFQIGPHALTVTGSIGIALYPDDGQDDSTLLRNADAAMYRAKSEGRNGFQFYSADMNMEALGELLLENQLRSAVERSELRLYYQPKVAAADARITGAEALLRWAHPQLGVLGPDRFVPVAEESGLIVSIGEWVLREAGRQLREWIDAGLDVVPIAVNLSARQFLQQDLIALVSDVLAVNRLDAGLIELELTETLLMRDIELTIETLSTLSEMGVRLSIDDFGSGYSSFAYLSRFKVDVLKIDRSFVSDIRPGGNDGQIPAAIIALAHNLGRKVVAEGVETVFQRDFLASHGCDELQGYLFSRPEPVEDFVRRLGSKAAV